MIIAMGMVGMVKIFTGVASEKNESLKPVAGSLLSLNSSPEDKTDRAVMLLEVMAKPQIFGFYHSEHN